VKPALVIAVLLLVGAGVAAFSVLGDRADQRVVDAFDTPCEDPGDPFVALPAGYSYRAVRQAADDQRGEGREIRRGTSRVGAIFAYSSADAEALPDTFADSYAEDGMQRAERDDVIVLSRGQERMLVGARGCHVLTLMTVPQYEEPLEQAFFRSNEGSPAP
jgi:hypothetical protein